MNRIYLSLHNWLALKINNDCLKQNLSLMNFWRVFEDNI